MTTEMTILNAGDEGTIKQLAQWKMISIDEARAHVAMVKGTMFAARKITGYTANYTVGPQTWGRTSDDLLAEFVAKGRRGNGRRGKRALVAKYGENAANNIIDRAKAAR